jgi:hypothetical protein
MFAAAKTTVEHPQKDFFCRKNLNKEKHAGHLSLLSLAT